MPANLRFVTNPAQTHPHKLPSERIGYGLTEACLPDTRRTQQTENWSLTEWVQFAHREIFDQPALHFGQVIMIAIENLLGFVEVEIVVAQFRPRQLCDRLDITDDHRILGAGWWDDIEPLQLALGLCEYFGRWFGCFEFRSKNRDVFVGARVAFAQFALNGLELSAQISLALRIAKLRLHILLELLLNLGHFQLRAGVFLHGAHTLAQIEFIQNRLSFVH